MNTTFTIDIKLLTEKSQKLIKLMEELPDSYFNDNCLSPSNETIKKILNYSLILRAGKK